jgi:hypothetical protein
MGVEYFNCNQCGINIYVTGKLGSRILKLIMICSAGDYSVEINDSVIKDMYFKQYMKDLRYFTIGQSFDLYLKDANDINSKKMFGYGVLEFMTKFGSDEMCQTLIEHGAKRNLYIES